MTDPPALAPRAEPIAPGEPAPPFRLPAVTTDGTEIEVALAVEAAKDTVMLVFYQDDGMPICTRELNSFAQEFELLAEAGIQLFGINTNGLGSHAKFQERDHFPFPLISDFYGEATKAFGLWDADEGKSRRAIVIIEPGGIVKYVLPHFNPGSVASFEEVFRALGLA
jgi:peroxiredoxin